MSINKQSFIKYGRFDTLEHAKNGLKGKDINKLAKARLDLYNIHQKAKELLNGPEKGKTKT